MKLSREFLDLASIRQDGGTQVRESLDRKWVEELAELYRDGHELPRPVVMRDADDVDWLVDGFHRLAALAMNKAQGVQVEILEGTLDMAKAQAARANMNGLPRTPGDKKRAILLMLSTSEGRKMGQRELAKHCGVAHSYVQKVAGFGVASSGHAAVVADTHSGVRAEKAATRSALIRESSLRGESAEEIASATGIDVRIVRRTRREHGFKSERELADEKREAARSAWAADPLLTVADVSRITGLSYKLAREIRDEIGLVPVTQSEASKRGRRGPTSLPTAAPPSAPPRKNDPRDAVEIEHKQPHLTIVRPMPAIRSPRIVAVHQAYDQVQDHELEWLWNELSAKHEERMARLAKKEEAS